VTVLREAIPADAAVLGALHVACWHETYTGILPDAMLAGLSVDTRAEMWRNILGDPDAFGGAAVFVAIQEDRIVGFGSCGAQRDEAFAGRGFGGEIGALYVLRAHQARGVGRALMAALARALANRGHDAVSLWVLRDNVRARGFYEALGGAVIGEKIDRQPDATLIDLAYGWPDLAGLVR